MNIYSLVKADHKEVKALLKQLTEMASPTEEPRSSAKSEALLQKITKALVAHNHAEEQVFYSRLRDGRKARVLAAEGKTEHDLGGSLLEELAGLDGASDVFAAKAKVLRELVEHHIKEEESEIHAEAKKELSAEDAKAIGEDFLRVKGQLLDQIGRSETDGRSSSAA